MRWITVCLMFVLCIFSVGCTHTRVLSESTSRATIAQYNQELGGRLGQVELKGEKEIWARNVVFHPDSTFWTSYEGKIPQAFPNGDIDHVTMPDRKKGLVEGSLYGASYGTLIGGVLGVLLGIMIVNQPEPSYAQVDSSGFVYGYHREHKNHTQVMFAATGLGALAGAVAGGTIGVFIGGTQGSLMEVKFRFPVSTPDKVRKK